MATRALHSMAATIGATGVEGHSSPLGAYEMQVDVVFVDIFKSDQRGVVHRPEDVDLPLKQH